MGNHARAANCLPNGSHLLLQCLGKRCEFSWTILENAQLTSSFISWHNLLPFFHLLVNKRTNRYGKILLFFNFECNINDQHASLTTQFLSLIEKKMIINRNNYQHECSLEANTPCDPSKAQNRERGEIQFRRIVELERSQAAPFKN